MTRLAFENEKAMQNLAFDLLEFLNDDTFDLVDQEFMLKYPIRDVDKYIDRYSRSLIIKHGLAAKKRLFEEL